MMLVYLMFES